MCRAYPTSAAARRRYGLELLRAPSRRMQGGRHGVQNRVAAYAERVEVTRCGSRRAVGGQRSHERLLAKDSSVAAAGAGGCDHGCPAVDPVVDVRHHKPVAAATVIGFTRWCSRRVPIAGQCVLSVASSGANDGRDLAVANALATSRRCRRPSHRPARTVRPAGEPSVQCCLSGSDPSHTHGISHDVRRFRSGDRHHADHQGPQCKDLLRAGVRAGARFLQAAS